jgi:hypothetical protein
MLAAAGLHQWAGRRTDVAGAWGSFSASTTAAAAAAAGTSSAAVVNSVSKEGADGSAAPAARFRVVSTAAGAGSGGAQADSISGGGGAVEPLKYYPWDVLPVGGSWCVVTLHGGDGTTGVVLLGEYLGSGNEGITPPSAADSRHTVCAALGGSFPATAAVTVAPSDRPPGGVASVAVTGSWGKVRHLSAEWPQELLCHPNMMELDPWLKITAPQ